MRSQFNGGKSYDQPCTWRYVGSGIWQCQVEAVPDLKGFSSEIRYTGKEIVVEERNPTNFIQQKVFVRADSQTNIDDYLNKR